MALLSLSCNAPILRISVLKQDSRMEIFRTFARRHTLKNQARTPPTNRRIHKMASFLFSKVCNASARIRIQIFRTGVDEKPANALHTRVSCRRNLKEQVMTPPIDKAAEFYKAPLLFSKAYNGLRLRVKVLNQRPRMQIFRTFGDKFDALRTRINHKRILQEEDMAPAKSKETNKMVSLLFSKVSNVLTLRLKMLQGISLKHIFGTFVAKSKDNLHSSVSRIPFKEQISKTNNKLVESNKLASSLFGRIYNDLTLPLKVLKPVGRKQIFRRLTYESPISALRTSRLHKPTNKRLNIDKSSLTIFSVGIGTLFIYKLGLLNQPYNIEKYLYLGCSFAIAVPSAMAALYSPLIMNILTRKGVRTQVINMVAIIVTGVVTQNMEYNPGFGYKQLALLLNASGVGIMFAPILVGAVPTTGVIVGFFIITACASKETLYDPINEALSIFREILNIVIRIAVLAKAANKNK